jgi:endonuclease G
MKDLSEILRAAVTRIQDHDRPLSEELLSVRQIATGRTEAEGLSHFVPELATEGDPYARAMLSVETIVLRVGRPVLAIVNDEARLDFHEAESEIWRARLLDARESVSRAAKAVGRIELSRHPFYEWVGTGWLVDEEVVVTNRHVANEFGRLSGDRFVFKLGLLNQPMAATIDFVEEFDRTASLEFSLREILHIEGEDGPDMAFLRVERVGTASLAPSIPLSRAQPESQRLVAVIGYPARDSRIGDQALMQQIFGDVYDKKRLAPGQITRGDDRSLEHDCSTLGGNSGSVVLDLITGEAVGLHFAGRFLQANYAVPAHLIADKLRQIQRITSPAPTVLPPAPGPSAPTSGSEEVLITEAVPTDYEDRVGYREDFLEDAPLVALPQIDAADDILTYELNNRTNSVLPYEHFSVVMSISRRLCFFSAVNIDGNKSRKVKRTTWRTDPRVPADAQILQEAYGNAPKFSRGHMTRREDPIWGDVDNAAMGNADSMHVTNTVPQMQPFNAGIWLGLENYALDHAREDKMQISVFTGPFLLPDDPVLFDVKIPRSFWKVIVFVHDQTSQLCATGYSMSQEDFLREEEFVFGQHKTSQIPLKSIEQKAGISFGALSSSDPMKQIEEAMPSILTDFRQIQFLSR